jgi:penicillin G amidase
VSGVLNVSGLTAPVRIVRDRYGVPHIYAQSRDDLFFAQGFVQAEDRLFQMDLWRRASQGRLSEVLGPNFVARDVMTRRMQYRGDPDAEWASYGPEAKAIAEAFVRGINAWVTLARERPPEAFVLAGWPPEEWSAADLLSRTDAFRSSGDAVDEAFRARLVAAVGAPRANVILGGTSPPATADGLEPAAISPLIADVIRRAGAPPLFAALAAPIVSRPSDQWLPAMAIADTAAVQTLNHPSPRYLVHLNAPGWNVIGATAPWLPGVVIGHNDRVAWNLTVFDADTQDLYVERINPANPHQVEDEGRWADTTIVNDVLHVKGRAKAFTFAHEFTRHGPIVASDQERHLAFVVRWSGSEPGAAAELGALALDQARSAPELRGAVARWKMPARTIEFEDAGGRGSFQAAALVPIRGAGSGTLPSPGWTRAYDWRGWRTLDELPHGDHARGGPADASGPTIADRPGLLELVRAQPARADVLLRDLGAAGSPAAQRAILAKAIAGLRRERAATADAVLFAHPLAITAAAKERFNIGPLARPPSGAHAFTLTSNTRDWDQALAMNAPGQSESPDSPHFADLARRWTTGEAFALPFSDQAVEAAAEATLTITPRVR